MKVLVLHNRYLQRGGEDAVFEDEVKLLRDAGHEVRCFERNNTELAQLPAAQAAWRSIWSSPVRAELTQLMREWRPDVMHVHNTFQVISASAYSAANALGVPVVQTLHNYRLMCIEGTFFRERHICEDCLTHGPLHGVKHACYRGSLPQSAVITAGIVLHRKLGTYRRHVQRYIALSEHSKANFVRGGLPADRIVVKPNFAWTPPAAAPGGPVRGGYGLLVGRLTQEKGATLLADALRLRPARVVVAGSGPEEANLAAAGAEMMGWTSRETLGALMAGASYVVVPSETYEQFPRVVAEAYGAGKPLLAARLGALGELVIEGVTGRLFEPGSVQGVAELMAWADAHPDTLAEMGLAARARYEALYSPESNLAQLEAIYRDAMAAVSET